ncbi:uncharacterized protein [Apostichopus japonicus]|uniref:uncharacterized protein n=1 Tax=Stichopus japonicus TaxID=307972 RepID=UPI003AB45DDD
MASIRNIIRYSVLQLSILIILCFLPLGKGVLNNSIYALLAPYAGCQDNWYELEILVIYDSITQRTAISDPLSANIQHTVHDNSSITLTFCVWNGTANTIPHEPVPYEETRYQSYDELDTYDTLFDLGERKAGYLDNWPPGQYCIYNVGKLEMTPTSIDWDYGRCPDGFEPGTSSYPFIALPGGFGSTRYSPLGPFITHANQTSIEFCCSTPSTTKPSSSQISLPFVKPFYLMPVNSKTCQPVKNTEVRLDWIQWPHLEHEGGLHPYIERGPFGNGTVFYMCYYIPNVNKLIASLTYVITLGSVFLSITFFFMMGWCHRKRLEWNHNRMLSLQYSGYNKDDSV